MRWGHRHPVLAGWTAFVAGHAAAMVGLAGLYAAGYRSELGLAVMWYVLGWLLSSLLVWMWYRGDAFGVSWARRNPLWAGLTCVTVASFPPFVLFGWVFAIVCFWVAFRQPAVKGA